MFSGFRSLCEKENREESQWDWAEWKDSETCLCWRTLTCRRCVLGAGPPARSRSLQSRRRLSSHRNPPRPCDRCETSGLLRSWGSAQGTERPSSRRRRLNSPGDRGVSCANDEKAARWWFRCFRADQTHISCWEFKFSSRVKLLPQLKTQPANNISAKVNFCSVKLCDSILTLTSCWTLRQDDWIWSPNQISCKTVIWQRIKPNQRQNKPPCCLLITAVVNVADFTVWLTHTESKLRRKREENVPF